MEQVRVQGRARTNDVDFDYGIRDLQVFVSGGDVAVFSSTGPTGGMAGYRLNGGTLEQVDTHYFSAGAGMGLSVSMTLLAQGGGQMMVGGHGAGRVSTYDLNVNGQIGAHRLLSGVSGADGPQATGAAHGNMVFLANPWDNGFAAYSLSGATLSQIDSVSDTGQSFGFGIRDMVTVDVGANSYLITAAQGQTTSGWSVSETGLSSYSIGPGAVTLRDSLGAEDGLGLMVPTAITTASAGGRDYVLMASAQGNSGALSLIRVQSDGDLVLADHVGDTRATRFAAAQAVEAIEANGRTYVVAGGGDDGVSLFTLAPGGHLVHLDAIANSAAAGLNGVTELALAVDGGRLHVFAASQSDAGLTHLTFDISDQGQTRQVSGNTVGSAADDLLAGRGGANNLDGGGGDDILLDGAGQDTLRGGGGEDLFVLQADDALDRIVDFDVDQDQIDLSGWAYFKSAGALQLTRTNTGIRITWHDEELDVRSSDFMSFDALRAAITNAPTRIFEAPAVSLTGTAGADLLQGDWAADSLSGAGGNDTLLGFAGDDRLWGGDGNDVLEGGSAHDDLRGGSGQDTLRGGDHDDLLAGGSGADVLDGGAGNDTLTGESGNDLIDGAAGWDMAMMEGSQKLVSKLSVVGSNRIEITSHRGTDVYSNIEAFSFSDGVLSYAETIALRYGYTLKGTAGPERLTGGEGRDTISGGGGNDTLSGMDGNDVLTGGAGYDHLYGGAGYDRAMMEVSRHDILRVATESDGRLLVITSQGWDRFQTVESFRFTDATLSLAQMLSFEDGRYLTGGAGNDVLSGGAGSDTLRSGGGNDQLFGKSGDDRLYGGAGRDTIRGDDGWDHLSGGAGNDVLIGGTGTDLALLGGTSGGYAVKRLAGGWIEMTSADGVDRFHGVEKFQFRNETLTLTEVLSGGGGTTVKGMQGADRLTGGGGGDLLNGQGGSDTLLGGGGNDTLLGGDGDDLLLGQDGRDRLIGAGGNDRIKGGADKDFLSGGGGRDKLFGDSGNDKIKGGGGHDIINGGSGKDVLIGQGGNDKMKGGKQADFLSGGGGHDLLIGAQSDDKLKGGGGNDRLSGGTGDDKMAGQKGADVLKGGAGRDILSGNAGKDRLEGGRDNDRLSGGSGADDFVFRTGDDADVIRDFDTVRDTLLLQSRLVNGRDDPEAVLRAFGEVTGKGVVLDFGDGDRILLEDVASLRSLIDNIEIL